MRSASHGRIAAEPASPSAAPSTDASAPVTVPWSNTARCIAAGGAPLALSRPRVRSCRRAPNANAADATMAVTTSTTPTST
jgi:hypothetical protein